MSDPTDQNPSDPNSPEPVDDKTDDKALSSLYARGSTEQPSDALDQSILEKARKASGRRAAPTHRYSGWPRAVSIAAVLVMSVLVVTVIHERTPKPLSVASRPAVVQEEKATETPSKALPAPMNRPAERRKAEAPAAEGPATERESEEAPPALADRLALNNEEKDQRQRPAGKETLGKAITAAPATVPGQEPMAAGVASGDVQGLIQEEKHCARMTEQECLSSAACTLTKTETGPGYQCRFAKDHCELMFRQSEGTKDSCEAKTGCVYVPASCYCPPDTKCECAGGEPAQCQSRQ